MEIEGKNKTDKSLTSKLIFLYLILVPTLVFGQLMTEEDKQQHFTAGGIVSALTYGVVYKRTNNRKKALVYSIASSIVVGALKELADSRVPGNKFDTRDLLATSYGGISIGVTLNLVTRKKKKK